MPLQPPKRLLRFASLAPSLLALAACGPSDNEPGPGGVTVSEAKALDEAAEMIEQGRLPEDAIAPRPEEARAEAETAQQGE
jgi:hypothetical protein